MTDATVFKSYLRYVIGMRKVSTQKAIIGEVLSAISDIETFYKDDITTLCQVVSRTGENISNPIDRIESYISNPGHNTLAMCESRLHMEACY